MYNFNEVKLDRSLYGLANKSFSQALGELDPDEAYKGTPLEGLDAFERQLKRFDIKVAGVNSDLVEKFFQSGESAALFPEFVSRCVRQGMQEASCLSEVIAASTRIAGLDYRPMACKTTGGASYLQGGQFASTVTAQGAELDTTALVLSSSLCALQKRGRMLEASYEAVRYQRLDLFAVTLRQIGASIAQGQLSGAAEYLLALAEGTTPAVETLSTAGETLAYADLIALWASFGQKNLTTLLVSPTVMAQILSLPELIERVQGDYMTRAMVRLPFGAAVIKTDALDDATIIGLDKSCALEMVVADELTVESDKLINKQTERTAITATGSFSLIFADAARVMTIGA